MHDDSTDQPARPLNRYEQKQADRRARFEARAAATSREAQAVHDMCFGPIQPSCPASIMQLHPNCVVIADEAALSLCK